MAQYHPNIYWLVDFSSGNLPLANALCVSAHLEYCGQCRQRVAELNALGGSLLQGNQGNDADIEPMHASKSAGTVPGPVATPSHENLLASVFETIDRGDADMGVTNAKDTAVKTTAGIKSPAATAGSALSKDSQVEQLPGCVRKLLPDSMELLPWQKLGRTLSVARLGVGDPQHEVALHRMRAGGSVANHDHRGEEVTVVLQGSFADQQGLYQRGDFLLMGEGNQHQPTATADRDCLCLSSVAAPIRFTGSFSRLLNPFLRIHPGA